MAAQRSLVVRDLTDKLLPAIIEGAGKRFRVRNSEEYFRVLRYLKDVDKITINGLVWTPQSRITYDMLTGKNLFLLRKRVTAVKNQMYNQVRGQKTLLSIGAGRGSDIYRWRQFEKVLLVEPNADHIKELKRRLSFFPDINYKIIQARGQETERIMQETLRFMGKPDVIEFMLSLTFFDFSNREELGGLGRLMRFADYILIFTPDRTKMLNLINSGYKFQDMRLSLENNKVLIHIPNSIVEDQEEFLVPTNIFERLSGGEIIFKADVTAEKLLTSDEKQFLNVFVAIVIKR